MRHSVIFAGLAVLAVGRASAAAPPGPVTLTANPARVCIDETAPSYLNFDLLVRNGTAEELKIAELRGIVLDADGRTIERRMIWQQSVSQLAPDQSVPAKGEAMIFNPLLFRTARAGSRIRYEIAFAGQPQDAPPVSTIVVPEDCANKVRLIAPVTGRLLVYDGYDLYSHHRRTGYGGPEDAAAGITDNFQRFGIDLVHVDEHGRFYRGDGMRPDQWLGWGQPVRAAGDGVVAALHDGQPDNVVIGQIDQWTDRDMGRNPMTSYGNYVLIDHGGGEFSLVGHLRNGSVTVRKGERVQAGQRIGQVGNSGASGGVHVHYERRSGWGIAGIRTLPPYFEGVTRIGQPPARRTAVAIDSGDVLIAR